jgi:hypothetical protein
MAGVIERTLPRISVNKLGEYMTATPSRRRLIIRDQRRPKGFLVPRYNEAQAAIVSYLTSQERDVAPLLAEIERLHSLAAESSWEAQRNISCAEALEAFLDLVDNLPSGVKLAPGPGRPPLLTYGEVLVSVRPELLAEGTNRQGESTIGAWKLYFSKTTPLSPEGGRFVATAVADFAERFLALTATADYRLCLAIDVFAGKIYTAPRARTRRRNDLAAACDEIARAWSTV